MTTTTLERTPADLAVERIDHHLAALPPGRELISVDEHTDMLLDLRNLFTTTTQETTTP